MAKLFKMEEALSEAVIEICYKKDELADPIINDYHAVSLGFSTKEELAKLIKSESLTFLSENGMYKGLEKNICMACFTGKYPTSVFSLLENIDK